MIWYLLYPLRGTSKPATLHDDHYLRRAISRLGTVVARHPITTIIVAIAIGVSLSVPALFLHHPASSMSYPKPPSHVWTSAESFPNSESLIPDISIKQAWIYGSWMKALERETLLEALAIQNVLLGSILNHDTGSDIAASFLHSPLLYWNCSDDAIALENSILTTINSHVHQKSLANITLRPSSVLAGSLSSYNRLVAADALVVSLLYRAESKAGDLWDECVETLAHRDQNRWQVYPANVRGAGSRFFRLQSRPLSVQDDAVFFGLYSLILLYVVFGLGSVRMLKSKIGLFVAIAMQECFSIFSGFMLAKFFYIDVSSIPPAAYPFIVLVVGLENIFRLVREVEKSSLQDQSVPRVAAALGAVGHLSLITVAQNLFILGLISIAAPPGLAAFCEFAAISITVDLVFFFTFFVSILGMDLRNYGLQDSFDDVRTRYGAERPKTARMGAPAQRQRRDITRRARHAALLYPRPLVPMVVILFLFMLDWHLFERPITSRWARNFAFISNWSEFKTARAHLNGSDSILKQSRDSISWLDSQEHETIRELFQIVKPQSHNLLARVYDPLVIVLKFADRNAPLAREIMVSSPMATIIFGPVWLSVVLLCGTAVLMSSFWNYFSSDDTPDENGDYIQKAKSFSSVQCLPRGHSLDVFMLRSSSKCILASVGFDHEIRVWNLESRITANQLIPISQHHKLWPVATVAIDAKAEWLAICSKSGDVSFWNIRLQCFGRSTTIILDNPVVTCFFTSSTGHDNLHSATQLLLVSASGRLTEIEVETANVISHQICANRVQSSYANSHRHMPLRLITVNEDNKIYITAKRQDCWISQALQFSVPILNQPSRLRFTVIPDLRMVVLVWNIDTCQLCLVDLLSGIAIYTFYLTPFSHQTLRAFHSPPQQCLFCGAVALISFSIAYSEEQDGSFTMITLSAEPNPRIRTGLICLRAERDVRERRCIGFASGSEKTYSMRHAGVWEATGANGVAGLRRKRQDSQRTSETFPIKGNLMRRKAELTKKDATTDGEAWEAWTMTATGIINTHALNVGVFTNRVGPICSVGRNAIAAGLAEDIVLVQFGDQLHDDDDADEVVRKPTRTRFAGRSKFGTVNNSGI